MTLFDTTTLKIAGATEQSEIAPSLSGRADVLGMIQKAEDAVLRPKEFGAFDHDLRAAIAGRIALLAGDEALSAHYAARAKTCSVLASPSETGAAQGLEIILRFVDKVANQARDVTADDISGLQAAGISDADIVRLCELIAFLAFQTRVVSGLRLMQGEVA